LVLDGNAPSANTALLKALKAAKGSGANSLRFRAMSALEGG
jgi:hypothetical protein